MNIKNKNIEFLAIMVNKKIKFDRITLLMISKQKKSKVLNALNWCFADLFVLISLFSAFQHVLYLTQKIGQRKYGSKGRYNFLEMADQQAG